MWHPARYSWRYAFLVQGVLGIPWAIALTGAGWLLGGLIGVTSSDDTVGVVIALLMAVAGGATLTFGLAGVVGWIE